MEGAKDYLLNVGDYFVVSRDNASGSNTRVNELYKIKSIPDNDIEAEKVTIYNGNLKDPFINVLEVIKIFPVTELKDGVWYNIKMEKLKNSQSIEKKENC